MNVYKNMCIEKFIHIFMCTYVSSVYECMCTYYVKFHFIQYTYIHLCIYINVYTYIYVYVYMFVYLYIYMYFCVYMYFCICVSISYGDANGNVLGRACYDARCGSCIYTYIYIYIFTHRYIYTYIHVFM